ncbi:hypothetical protein, partial [Micromonospora noduli]|uniref:hypothetical protein n=1 Tax=Micromonospora noduli TaxID=709876 RepID=UPI001474195D
VPILEAAKGDVDFDFKFGVYYMACACILTEFISIHWKNIIKFCLYECFGKNSIAIHSERYREYAFIVCSVMYLENPDLSIFKKSEKKFLNSFLLQSVKCSKDAYLFALSVQEGHELAVRHYWNLMAPEERENHMLPAVFEHFT